MLDPLTFLALLLGSTIVSILYVWLGTPYASTMMLVFAFMGMDLKRVVGTILVSQIFAAFLGSYLRKKRVSDPELGTVHGLAIGMSATVAFLAAFLLGTSLPNESRLALNASMLAIAGVALLLPLRRTSTKIRSLATSIGIGACTGMVKGLLGGSATPMLIATHRLLGLGIDDAMFRTLIAEVPLCLAASVPYVAMYGLPPTILATLFAGCVLGTSLGRYLGTKPSIDRSRISSIVFIVISAILYLEALEVVKK